MSGESSADAILLDHTHHGAAPLAGRSRALPDVVALGALLAAVLFVLGVAFWSRYNLYRLDIVTFYIPWYEHLGERLRDADIPGWMPYAMLDAMYRSHSTIVPAASACWIRSRAS